VLPGASTIFVTHRFYVITSFVITDLDIRQVLPISDAFYIVGIPQGTIRGWITGRLRSFLDKVNNTLALEKYKARKNDWLLKYD
jgi:hypothetical protein